MNSNNNKLLTFLLFTFITVAIFALLNQKAECEAQPIPPPVNQLTGIDDGVFNNLAEADCRLCHEDPDIVDDTNIPNRHHLLVGTPVPDPTVRPFPDGDTDGNYDCLSCHDLVWDPVVEKFVFEAFRDCLFCHVQIPGEASVHHMLPVAQGTDSTIGDPDVGDCTPCHGTLVDDTGDGHFVPTFTPSMTTPKRSGGNGLPLNSRGKGAGACDYCHDEDVVGSPVAIYKNVDTHHEAGFGSDPSKCSWCHDFSLPFGEQIRICENCHGPESLHAIQVDSDATGLVDTNGDGIGDTENAGNIIPNMENQGWGHIGKSDDCWGCHGFGFSSTSGPGPVFPHIEDISQYVLTAGADTAVTLTGTAFTDMSEGTELTSNVVLIAADGTSTSLTADAISESSLTVTLPGTAAPGNYALQAVKVGLSCTEKSNPLAITIVPEVVITADTCSRKKGLLTIDGSGFGTKPEGTDAYINVEVNGQTVDIISWTDTQIKASVYSCPNNAAITVNALFGSAARSGGDSGGGGKPPKPCKGKRC